MRITSGTHRSILFAATMVAKCIAMVLTAFSLPASVLVCFKTNYSLQFHLSENPLHVGFALSPLYSHFSPIRHKAVAASFVEQSMCLTMSLATPTLRFSSAASEWVLGSAPQICSSFLILGTTLQYHQHKYYEFFSAMLHYSIILVSLLKSCLTNQEKDKRI